jgi:hypothetical protein
MSRSAGGQEAQRTIVFIDYQNMYKRAQEAFWPEEGPGYLGNFKPLALARLLAEGEGRELISACLHRHSGAGAR